MKADPRQARRQVIVRHLERLGRSLDGLRHLSSRYSWIRLGIFLAGVAGAALAFAFGPSSAGWIVIGLFMAAFSLAVFGHRRLDRSIRRFQLASHIVQVQVARMDLDWKGIPASPVTPPSPEHPFETDLNVTGDRSLHQLLDTALSRGGSDRLLRWLLDTVPDLSRIHQRQALVREMLPLTGFRNRLALNGALVSSDPRERWDGERLVSWLEEHTDQAPLRRYLFLLGALALTNIILLGLSLFAGLPAYWAISLVLYGGVYLYKYREFEDVFDQAVYMVETLNRFRAVLSSLEHYRYPKGSRLGELCAPFWRDHPRPSGYLRKITRIAAGASMQENQVFWLLFNAAVPWDLYFGYRLQLYKEEVKTILPVWLEAWYELEALNSLANFAYLNPEYGFPAVVTEVAEGQPVFSARDTGHPLIPHSQRVRNDFSISQLGEIVLVTGSNMSGKSTFLRTLGVNLCLAFAGAVVDSTGLQTVLFRVFTSMNLSDSLSDGISYFYAEVRRLKSLLKEVERKDLPPVFFLIDEIFRGTNNRERQIGSRAYVQALARGNGVGVISTHDLELVTLEAQVKAMHNYHFREEVLDGRMQFDYRLRPGPSPTTNALKIMKLEGLPVDPGS